MIEDSRFWYTPPVPRGVPSEAETQRRMAFQARHPDVGFAFRGDREPPWVAYWLAAGDKRRYITGATLTDVLDGLAEEFGTAP